MILKKVGHFDYLMEQYPRILEDIEKKGTLSVSHEGEASLINYIWNQALILKEDKNLYLILNIPLKEGPPKSKPLLTYKITGDKRVIDLLSKEETLRICSDKSYPRYPYYEVFAHL
jgi:hypothetical protein